MTDNIVAMPTPMNVRADRIREASRKRTEGREAWIEWTVKLAIELAAACNTFSSDRAFNIWLAENDLGKDNLTENDRAALIQMGRHPDQLYEELCECDRELAPVTIWRKAQTRFGQLSKPNDPTPQAAEINIPPPTTPTPSTPTCAENKQPVQPPLPTPRHALVGSGNDLLQDVSKTDLVKLLDLAPEHYAAVLGAYPVNRQRKLKAELAKLAKREFTRERGKTYRFPGRKSARELFGMAFEAVKAGKAPVLTNSFAIDVRVFLPDVPEAFCRTFTLPQLAQRLDRLALLNAKAAELKAVGTSAFDIHAELSHIWETGAVRPPRVVKTVELPPEDSKNRIKHTVKYCGEVIWPHDSLKYVTYQDLNMGWHIADHWLKRLEVATPLKPNELLVEIMHLIQDLRAASSLTGVTDVMTMCVSAYAKRNQRRDKAELSDGMPPGRPR